MNYSFDFSNAGILRYLNSISGRLQTFLLEVPISELRNAIQEKERLEDLAYHQQRNTGQNIYKQNVLNYTLKEVIKANYDEKIFNHFEYTLALNSSRMQNHPQYGMRLVSRYPQKYYVGKKSNHYNHAREIQQLYGIYRGEQNQSNSQNLQAQQQSVNQNGEEFEQSQNGEEKSANQQQNIAKQQSNISIKEEQQFIVDDSIVESQKSDIIDDLESKLRQKKRKKRKQKNSSNKRSTPLNKTKTKPILKKTGNRRLKKIKQDNDQPQQKIQSRQNENQSYDQIDLLDFSKIQDEQMIKYQVNDSHKSYQQIANEKINNIILHQPSIRKKLSPVQRKKMILESQDDSNKQD